MPIYEYKCENGHLFDVIQRISEDPLTSCKECGAPVKKVMHPISIAFKGSGFYSTDYSNGRKKEKSTTDSSDSSSANGADSSASKKSDSADKKSENSSSKSA